jgi:hypothetical protein
MNYQKLVRDFALRTRANLDSLRNFQKVQSDVEVYEVTQLINSMLGLLVFPQQKYFDRIPRIPLGELVYQGWPVPEIEGIYPQVKDLRELVRYLRNAITHCNLEFLSDVREQISGLRVWNTNLRDGQITWKARLTLEDIEKITDNFIQLLLEDT